MFFVGLRLNTEDNIKAEGNILHRVALQQAAYKSGKKTTLTPREALKPFRSVSGKDGMFFHQQRSLGGPEQSPP